jgi:hypothetical protein
MTRLVQSSSRRMNAGVVKQHDQGCITHDDSRHLSRVATTPLQPQRLLEGFQRLAGSLNSLGRSVFSPCLCCLAVLQEGTSILSRPCAFLQTLLPPPPTFPRLFRLFVPTSPRLKSKTSTAHVSAPPRSSNLLSTFAQAPPDPSPCSSPHRARATLALHSSHAVAHLLANTPSLTYPQ